MFELISTIVQVLCVASSLQSCPAVKVEASDRFEYAHYNVQENVIVVNTNYTNEINVQEVILHEFAHALHKPSHEGEWHGHDFRNHCVSITKTYQDFMGLMNTVKGKNHCGSHY